MEKKLIHFNEAEYNRRVSMARMEAEKINTYLQTISEKVGAFKLSLDTVRDLCFGTGETAAEHIHAAYKAELTGAGITNPILLESSLKAAMATLAVLLRDRPHFNQNAFFDLDFVNGKVQITDTKISEIKESESTYILTPGGAKLHEQMGQLVEAANAILAQYPGIKPKQIAGLFACDNNTKFMFNPGLLHFDAVANNF